MKIILILLIIVVAAMLILYMYCHFENTKFNITEYNIYTDKIEKNMCICVLSDLHNYVYGDKNCRLMLAIDKMNPDIVVSAGDMVEAGRFAGKTKQTIDFLANIKDKYTFFYGVGNHETMLYNKKVTKYDKPRYDFLDAIEDFAKRGIDIAPSRDGSISFDEHNIKLSSLEIESSYYRKFKLKELEKDYVVNHLGALEADKFNILIGHDPNQIKAYSEYGADLVLSGHVHGGMVALPNGRGLVSTLFTLFPPYYAGIYRMKDTVMIVSRGIGNHSIHVRINNRAELLKINLIKED